jgi:heat shock protein HspQ
MDLKMIPTETALPRINSTAKYPIGNQVKHRIFGFRGVIFDVDPVFANSEEWYESIPENVRPKRDQPFYHLFAEAPNKAPYVAYVSEQNLVEDDEQSEPISHPEIDDVFDDFIDGKFVLRNKSN